MARIAGAIATAHHTERSQWRLTPRSSRHATAAKAWPLQAMVVIVLPRPSLVCLRARLSSNVRPHNRQHGGAPAKRARRKRRKPTRSLRLLCWSTTNLPGAGHGFKLLPPHHGLLASGPRQRCAGKFTGSRSASSQSVRRPAAVGQLLAALSLVIGGRMTTTAQVAQTGPRFGAGVRVVFALATLQPSQCGLTPRSKADPLRQAL